MERITAMLLCLLLWLAGTTVPTTSAAGRLTTWSSSAFVSCVEQEYFMCDTYQNILAKYPTLTIFGTVAADDVVMIATLAKVFAKYKIAVPADTKVSAAKAAADPVNSISMADTVAINLEQSSAIVLLARLTALFQGIA
jgi:hypothetical protein